MLFTKTAQGTAKCRRKGMVTSMEEAKGKKKQTGRKPGRKDRVFVSEEDCVRKLKQFFAERIAESGEVPDVEGLAEFLHTTRDELFRLKEHRVYGRYLERAFNSIAKQKKQLAFAGKLPAAVLSFDLKNNHGYRDKPEERGEAGTTVVFRGMAEEWAK